MLVTVVVIEAVAVELAEFVAVADALVDAVVLADDVPVVEDLQWETVLQTTRSIQGNLFLPTILEARRR